MSETTIEKRDIPVNIEDIMHTAYLQYSLSVNVGRAIPDVRDGLKPCNRRILFAMRQLGLVKSRAHMKSAKVVGEVIGNYHPHGDASVYDALVRMAQEFSMRSARWSTARETSAASTATPPPHTVTQSAGWSVLPKSFSPTSTKIQST